MPVSQELIALSNELVLAVHDHDCGKLEDLLGVEFTLNGAAGEMGATPSSMRPPAPTRSTTGPTRKSIPRSTATRR